MADTVLVVNAGSSSIKFSVYDVGGASSDLALSLKGQVDAIGTHPRLRARDASGRPLVDQTFPVSEVPDVGAAMERVAVWLLERFVPLAPLHQPHHLRPIRAIQQRFPRTLQVACFDTAFHRGHPDVADRFAIPEALYREGVRRYGFHGLSCEYIARALPRVAPEIAQGAVVVAHLGSGASMCAIKGGRSLDSTMAFTALDG